MSQPPNPPQQPTAAASSPSHGAPRPVPLPLSAAIGFAAQRYRADRATGALVAGMILAATALDAFGPAIAGHLIDRLTDRSLGSPWWPLAVLIALGVFVVILRDRALRWWMPVTCEVLVRSVADAFARVQRFPSSWHADSFAGATVRKLTRGLWALDLMSDLFLWHFTPAATALVVATVLLTWASPWLGLVVVLGAVVYVWLSYRLATRYVAPAATASNASDSELGAALADAIAGNPTVKAFAREAHEDRLFDRIADRWRDLHVVSWIRSVDTGTVQQIAALGLQAAMLTTALALWQAGTLSAGQVGQALLTHAVVHGYLRDVGLYLRDLQKSASDMEDMVRFMAMPVEEPPAPAASIVATGSALQVTRGAIRFEALRFTYPGQSAPLFDGLTLEIPGGQRVGFVGLSGSGKSTLQRLLMRLHAPDAGRVLIDGQDVAEVGLESLRSRIALVPQDPALFHRSLADNIAYAVDGADPAAIAAAAAQAEIAETIDRLPLGYATLVGERGVKLSGGERQRVAVARAILADRPILVLDEATSSLDSLAEAAIQTALDRLSRGRTTIVVAHRLSTLAMVERIVVFERGRIVEDGSHASLMMLEDGLYRRLWERQAAGLGLEPTAPPLISQTDAALAAFEA